MSLAQLSNNKISTYINSIICVAIMIFFGKIPAIDPITSMGMNIIGIFLGMVYGWITVGMAWPSILGLLMLGLSGYTKVNDAFRNGFGNSTVLLLFFVCIITGTLNSAGLTKYFSLKILSMKIAKGKPWTLTFLVLMVNYVCSAFLSPAASILICWSVLYSLCKVCEYKPGEKWPMLMVAGVMFAGNVSGQMFPFKNLAITVLGPYQSVENGTINAFGFVIWMLVTSFIAVVLYFLAVKYIFKPDVSKLVKANVINTEKLNSYQKWILGIFVVYVILMLLPDMLPQGLALRGFLKDIGNTGLTALVVCVMLFLNFKDSGNLNRQIFDGVNFNLIFLLASALTLADAFSGKETGIQDFIVQYAKPILENTSGVGFIIVCVLIVTVVTQVCNNAATATIFTPIILVIIAALGDVGVKTQVIMLMLVQGCAVATMLPSGGASAALLHGNKTWMTNTPMLYGLCALMLVINLFTLFVIGIPLSNILPM